MQTNKNLTIVTQDKLNTALSQYKRSVQLLLIPPHFLIFAYFFPVVLLKLVFIPLIFVVFWAWCDLIHTIEEAHRNDILNLIYTSDSDQTKQLLAYQLFEHDQHSLAGGHPFNR